jgi:hypothetical protein
MAPHESEALWAFASDALEAHEQARVAEHVADCEACAQALAKVRQAQAMLRAVEHEVPEVRWDEADDRIQSAAARRLARLERKPRWPWALTAAGVLAAAGVAFLVLRPTVPPPPPSAPVASREESSPSSTSALQEEPAPAPAQPPVAPSEPALASNVESASGTWIREAGVPERLLRTGTQLREGASVRTQSKSSALLRLPDASHVRLSSDSEVTLARADARNVHLTVTRGRIAVQASHVERQGFTVEAAGVRTSVVGTVFSVECTEHGAVVAVQEGKVRVDTEGQSPRFVTAGERLEVNSGQKAPEARALSAQDRQAFQELKLQLTAPASKARQSPVPESPPPPPDPTPTPEHSQPEVTSTEPTAPVSESPATQPKSAGATDAPAPGEPGSEFAPYPGPTSPEPAQEMATAPLISAPESPSSLPKPRHGFSEARFLLSAEVQFSAVTCERYLAGLAEIAESSRIRTFREQARHLRAQCFAKRRAKAEAEAEYTRYLQEFPNGRHAREARAALQP